MTRMLVDAKGDITGPWLVKVASSVFDIPAFSHCYSMFGSKLFVTVPTMLVFIPHLFAGGAFPYRLPETAYLPYSQLPSMSGDRQLHL
jgi:hypothetical protein